MSKLYVGLNGTKREVFRSQTEPTFNSHGHLYAASVGPFRTKRGAEIMALYGGNNPHLQCVADAEAMARREKAN